jgi:hypothetical protein
MSSFGTPMVALFGACIFALGCGVTPADGEEDVSSVEEAWIYGNGDSPTSFWANLSYLRRLARQPLTNSNGDLTATPLLATPEGQLVLHYVVGCALDPGATVSSPAWGVSYDGSVGLGSAWKSGPLSDEKSQRWVTACLLQTLNGLGLPVPIHMMGNHPGLADGPGQDASKFIYPDATMFGNIFAPTPLAYACLDRVVPEACGGMASNYASMRFCDSSPSCGLTLLPGDCTAHCTVDGNGNPTCKAAGVEYDQAISTTLMGDDWQLLYRSCPLPRL